MKRRTFCAGALGGVAAVLGLKPRQAMGPTEPATVYAQWYQDDTYILGVAYSVPWGERHAVWERLEKRGVEFCGESIPVLHHDSFFTEDGSRWVCRGKNWECWDHHLPTNTAYVSFAAGPISMAQLKRILSRQKYFWTEDLEWKLVDCGVKLKDDLA